jgi:phage baseplate assembly protein W
MATTVGTPGAIQTPSPTGGFMGQGVKYPLTLTSQGRLQLSNGTTCVEDSLRAILETAPGERAMLPGYGAKTGEFEPIDLQRMVAKFKKDVADYEPRVESIVAADIGYGPGVGEASVNIVYQLVGEANERILTYPIFVGPV